MEEETKKEITEVIKRKVGRPKKNIEPKQENSLDINEELKKATSEVIALSDGNAQEIELAIRWTDKEGINHEDIIAPTQILRRTQLKGVENGELNFEFYIMGNYSIFIGLNSNLELSIG